MSKPVDTVRLINRGLDAATRSIDNVSEYIKDLENAMRELERDEGEVKKDTMTKVELSTCSRKVQALKSAINRLETELSDTQIQIDKVRF